jgi:hypothetical protein
MEICDNSNRKLVPYYKGDLPGAIAASWWVGEQGVSSEL